MKTFAIATLAIAVAVVLLGVKVLFVKGSRFIGDHSQHHRGRSSRRARRQ